MDWMKALDRNVEREVLIACCGDGQRAVKPHTGQPGKEKRPPNRGSRSRGYHHSTITGDPATTCDSCTRHAAAPASETFSWWSWLPRSLLWPVAAGPTTSVRRKPPTAQAASPIYRTSGPHLVVCKDDLTDFTNRIAEFPADLKDLKLSPVFGMYRQRVPASSDRGGSHHCSAARFSCCPAPIWKSPASLRSDACRHLDAPVKVGYQILTYEQQRGCPHEQNLVGIFGIKDLQIEGTGASPSDVIFDAQFRSSTSSAATGPMASTCATSLPSARRSTRSTCSNRTGSPSTRWWTVEH